MTAPAPTWNAAFPLLSPREQERLACFKWAYAAEASYGFNVQEARRLAFVFWMLRKGLVTQ
jgi:hypothetical protein